MTDLQKILELIEAKDKADGCMVVLLKALKNGKCLVASVREVARIIGDQRRVKK